MQRFNGRAEASGIIVTSGLNATTPADLTYAGATVTVNVHGGGLASIFSDNVGTPLANPFTANADATLSFYAANGRYDVVITGAGVPTIALSDILLFDSTLISGANNALAFSATPVFSAALFSSFSMTLTGNVTASTLSGGATGNVIFLSLTQGAGGPWTFAWPANVANPPTLTPTAGKTENFCLALEADGLWHVHGIGEYPFNQIAALTGTGNVSVLQQTPTINSPTISVPSITGGGSLSGTFTGNPTFSGSVTASGNLTATAGQNILNAYNFNNVIWVDGIKYTSIAAAYAALPATGGCVVCPPNYTETLAANLVLSKNNAGIVLMGPGALTMGTNQILVSGGVRGAFIVGMMATGALNIGPSGGTSSAASSGFVLSYTGNASAIQCGSSLGGASIVSGNRFENFCIDLTGAGSSAIGINALGWQAGGWIRGVGIVGTGTGGSQIGIRTGQDGAAHNSFTWSIENNQILNLGTGILLDQDSQEIFCIGNQCSGFQNGCNIGLSIVGGNGNMWLNGDVFNCTTDLSITAGGGGGGNKHYINGVFGGASPAITLGAGVSNNEIVSQGQNDPVVTDNSGNGTNVVRVPGNRYISGGASIVRLGDVTLGASTTNITFSSIPSGYRALKIEIQARTDNAGALDNIALQFNGDTAANYDQESLTGNNVTASAVNVVGQTFVLVGATPSAGATRASIAGASTVTIPNYSSTTFEKSFHAENISVDSTAANGIARITGGSWRNTAAITSIKLFPQAGTNFVTGTRATLYGVN